MPTYTIKLPWFNELSQGWCNIILDRGFRKHRGGEWVLIDIHKIE